MSPRTRFVGITLLAAALLLGAGTELQAQVRLAPVSLGAHASLSDIRGGTWGFGGRFAAEVHESYALAWDVELVQEYFMPNCPSFDCNAHSSQLNLLARRTISSMASAYAGAGVAYQRFALEQGAERVEGDDWGINLILGARAAVASAVQPYLEVRFTFKDELRNETATSFGLRFPIGR